MSFLDLLDRPIAFHRAFVSLSGSVTAALFLSQTLYWSRRTRDTDGWIYKSRDEWTAETGMTRWEQEGARKCLKKLGVLEEKLVGLPAKLYYRLVESRLELLLSSLYSIDSGFSSNKPEDIPPSCRRISNLQAGGIPSNIYKESETTTETTTERDSSISSHSFDHSVGPASSQLSESEIQRKRFHDWVKTHWESLRNDYLPFFFNNVLLLRRSLFNCISWAESNYSKAKKFSDPGIRIKKWLEEEDVDRSARALAGQEKSAAIFSENDTSIAGISPEPAEVFLSIIALYKKLFSLFQDFAKDNLNISLTQADWVRYENDMLNNRQKYIDLGEPGFQAFYDFFVDKKLELSAR